MEIIARRSLLRSALGVTGAALLPLRLAQAQSIETARIVNGFPPGSTPDVLSRRVADRLVGNYAKSVIVENRAGAGGQLAATTVKNAAADGTTLLMTPLAVFGLYPLTCSSLPYNVDSDFAPVSLGVRFDIALDVGPGVPADVKTVNDFLAWAKSNPSRANVGLPALGSPMHFAAVELARLSKVPMQQVGYRGTVAAMPELLGGQLPALVSPLGEFLRHIPEGKLRVLATGGASRFAAHVLAEKPTALPEDPALATAVLEIEAHVAGEGWDQPARLYALVDTDALVAQIGRAHV